MINRRNRRFNKKINPWLRAFIVVLLYFAFGALYVLFAEKGLSLLLRDQYTQGNIRIIELWTYLGCNIIFLFIFILLNINIHNSRIEEIMYKYDKLEKWNKVSICEDEERVGKYISIQNHKEQLAGKGEEYITSIDGVDDVVWEWDLITDEFSSSEKWCNLTGYSIKKFFNFKEVLKGLVYEDDLVLVQENIEVHLEGKSEVMINEFRIKVKGRSYKWVLMKGKAVFDDEKHPLKIAGTLTDITAKKEYENKLYNLAYYNELTELPNKVMLIDRLEKILQDSMKNKSVGVLICISFDNLKSVMSVYGNSLSDKLIKQIKELIIQSVPYDNNAFSIQDDEIIILLVKLEDKSEVENICDNIHNCFVNPMDIEGKKIFIKVSTGITSFPYDGIDSNVLIGNVYIARDEARAEGNSKNRFFNIAMKDKMVKRIEAENVEQGVLGSNEVEDIINPEE